MGSTGGHSARGGQIHQVPQRSSVLTGSREGYISKKTLSPVKAESTGKLAPAAPPVVGRWEYFPPRFLQLTVLVRFTKSKMLLFGRFEIFEAGTTVNVFIGSPNKTSYRMMAFSFKGLSKCFHTTAC